MQQLPGPRAGARLDALAVRQRVDVESRWWLEQAGWPVTPLMRSRLRRLVDAEAAVREVRDHRDRGLAGAVAAWRAAARIVTGWDTVPWSPNVPCPVLTCEQRQSIRVRFEVHAATCVECGETWEGDRVLQLGRYVAWATVHLNGVHHLVADDAEVGVAKRPCPECAGERMAMARRRAGRGVRAIADARRSVA